MGENRSVFIFIWILQIFWQSLYYVLSTNQMTEIPAKWKQPYVVISTLNIKSMLMDKQLVSRYSCITKGSYHFLLDDSLLPRVARNKKTKNDVSYLGNLSDILCGCFDEKKMSGLPPHTARGCLSCWRPESEGVVATWGNYKLPFLKIPWLCGIETYCVC